MTDGAVFVDRDGVVNELVVDPVNGLYESPLMLQDVVLIDGAAAALRRLSRAGWRLIGVSNQPAAAKGIVPLSEIDAVQAKVVGLLSDEGVHFDDFRVCPHHPDGVVRQLARNCDCRKPAPGMLLAAADALRIDLAASWMIGDTDADVLAGQSVGCKTILVTHLGSAHKRSRAAAPDAAVPSLAAAADLILRPEE
jgi:D-glycero-D-manno-heptose 1,7-bisphosphate phosphatase